MVELRFDGLKENVKIDDSAGDLGGKKQSREQIVTYLYEIC